MRAATPVQPDALLAPARLAVAQIADEAEVERVWVFGSRARGDAGPRADCDLAVAAPRATPARWHAILARLEEAPTLVPFDVTRLEEAPPALRDEILRTGRLLFERAPPR